MPPKKPKARNLPKHALGFAKPVRLRGLGKRQVGVTPTVTRYAQSFLS